MEYLAEYFSPPAALVLNAPYVARADDDDPEVPIPPTGFQVMEAALFPNVVPDFAGRIEIQSDIMRPALQQLRVDESSVVGSESRIFDAMRLEIARVLTLGLAGFDAGLSGDAILEAQHSLQGLGSGLGPFRGELRTASPAAAAALEERLQSAEAYLGDHPDFTSFNRLAFIAVYGGPLATALGEAQRALEIPRIADSQGWSIRSDGIFDRGAMDPMTYAPWDAAPARQPVLSLGRRLFFEPRLSAGAQRSCATCHQPAQAFTDGRQRALVSPGAGPPPRNTPTLLNAALQPALFADERTGQLEDQVAEVIANRREMGLSAGAAADSLRREAGYTAAFTAAFPGSGREPVSPRNLELALAAYVRSLVALDSRFDRAARGDTLALTREERRGFNLFMGKAACGTCHFAPLFGGALPPLLQESEPEVIGAPARPGSGSLAADPDPGVGGVTSVPLHLRAFKTPSLRNVALTAPYMHNGVFRSLDQVVDFYNRGGGAGVGIELPNQTLSPSPLHLDRGERHALAAFLRALTDTLQMAH